MTTTSNIFAAAAPTIAKAMMKSTFMLFDSLKREHGDEGWMKLISNGGYYAKKSVQAKIKRLRPVLTNGAIDDEKLCDVAFTAAAEQTKALSAKVNAKVADLQNVKVERLNGLNFRITGTDSAGRNIEMVQSVIVNFSVRGTAYNQFPCRVYVDGVLTAADKV
jgi:hypothetical protein